jgi:RimJ/RimL family protein N-acetyltransferase
MTEHAPFVLIEVELRDHRRVRVREIRPADRDEIRQAFARLSAESRYMRFLSPMKELSPQMLERAIDPRSEGGLALVAEVDAPDGIDIVAGARYYVQPDGESCEFAIAVVDGWQGVGLASRLMRELIGAALARVLKRMVGVVLGSNRAMLDLAQRLGFTAKMDPHDVTVRVVRLDLAP